MAVCKLCDRLFVKTAKFDKLCGACYDERHGNKKARNVCNKLYSDDEIKARMKGVLEE